MGWWFVWNQTKKIWLLVPNTLCKVNEMMGCLEPKRMCCTIEWHCHFPSELNEVIIRHIAGMSPVLKQCPIVINMHFALSRESAVHQRIPSPLVMVNFGIILTHFEIKVFIKYITERSCDQKRGIRVAIFVIWWVLHKPLWQCQNLLIGD